MPRTDGTNDILCIGDYITLQSSVQNTFLSSEGILADTCCVSENYSLFEDNIFQVIIQRQYSATNEFEEFIKTHGREKVLKDPSIRKHHRALFRGQQNEIAMNEKFMLDKIGKQVTLGETIQLFHVKSMKILTVFANEPARDERENLSVVLDPNGSTTSWIQFSPRFKIDRDGDVVTNGMEVFLSVADRPGEYIHVADEKPSRGRPREVNCSLDLPTSWRVNIFHRAQEILDPSLTLTGQLVYLRDPEHGTMLAPFNQPFFIDMTRMKKKKIKREFNADDESSLGSVGTFGTIEKLQAGDGLGSDSDEDGGEDTDSDEDNNDNDAESNISDESEKQFVQDYGDVALMNISEEQIDTNAIWMIEGENRENGGPLSSSSGIFQLRHFNSGRYLGFSSSSNPNESKFILAYQGRRTEKRCLFCVKPISESGEFIHNERAVLIKTEKSSFMVKGLWDSSLSVYPLQTTQDANDATNFILNRYFDESVTSKHDRTTSEMHPSDIFVGKSIVGQLKILLYSIKLPENFNSNIQSIWPVDDASNSKLFMMITDCCVAFVYGEPLISEPDSNKEISKPTISTFRQRLLKEQGLLEIVLKTLHSLIPVSDALTALNAIDAKTRAASRSAVGPARLMKGALGMGKAVISKCLQLLLVLMQHNPSNQRIVSDHLHILVEHIVADSITVKVIQEILGNNKDLQESKIQLSDIIDFTRKLRHLPMNPHILHLLSSTCWVSSINNGNYLKSSIPRNQQIVYDVLYRKYRKLVIGISEDTQSSQSLTWSISQDLIDLYVPSDEELRSKVLYLDLLTKGVFSLSVYWEVPPKQTHYLLSHLFNSKTVSIREIFFPSNQQFATLKRDIGRFFVAQLQLAGDMCLGRNYKVMAELSKFFSFSSLLSILKMDLPTDIQGASARLLTNLYVDCEPQMQLFLPRMTRMWSEVGLPSYGLPISLSPDRSVHFAILQLIISEHLHNLHNRPYSACTSAYLLLLSKLLEFTFYGNKEQLVEVVSSLVLALDRRRVSQSQESLEESDPELAETKTLSDPSNQSLGARPLKRGSLTLSRKEVGPRSMKVNDSIITQDDDEAQPAPSSLFEKWSEFISVTNFSEKYNYFLLRVLNFLESLPVMFTVLFIVFMAIAEAFYVYFYSPSSIGWNIFEYIVFAIFAIDVFTRCYCHCTVRGSFQTFISDPFNQIDFTVVGMDVFVFALANILGSAGSFTKALRALRLLRLFRALRAMRMVNRMMNFKNLKAWTLPARYEASTSNEQQILTASQMLEILSSVQTRIEDTSISIFLQLFREWQEGKPLNYFDELTSEMETEILQVFEHASQSLSALKMSTVDYNDILIDLLMYGHPILVQNVLNVVMKQNTTRQSLLTHLNKLQLLVGPQREKDFSIIEKVVTQLTCDMDTFEMWSPLTEPVHNQIRKTVFDTLKYLTQACQKPMLVLDFEESFIPDPVVQSTLYHLGCLDVCLRFVRTLHLQEQNNTSDDSYQLNPVVEQLRLELIQACNMLIYWLILDNKDIQALAFEHIELFISIIDCKVNSHRIIKAIFRNNVDLVKRCPKHFLAHFVNLICDNGRFPQYLTLLSSICTAGGENVVANQYEVIRLISSLKNQKKVVLYFVPPKHPEYIKKVKSMNTYSHQKDISIDQLTIDLQYHIELVHMLSACSVGNEGLTSIDAKIQSMFPFHYAFLAIIDRNTILILKIELSLFIFNSILDVELKIPGLADADCVWEFLKSLPSIFTEGKEQLKLIEKHGWTSPLVHRQAVEYAICCANIVYGYFHFYFDAAIFRSSDMGNVVPGVERMHLKEPQAYQLMIDLYQTILPIYEMMSPNLSPTHYSIFYNALVALNNSMKQPLVPVVELLHSVQNTSGVPLSQDDEDSTRVRHKFRQFISVLMSSETLCKQNDEGILEFTSKLEELPLISELTNSDVRFEFIIIRLVKHLEQCLKVQVVGNDVINSMDPQPSRTSTWVLKVFRTMIENKWGMSLDERDESGGEAQDVASEALVKIFMNCGVVEVCLKMIAAGLDNDLQIEAMKLLAALLLRDGGAQDIQMTAHRWLNKKGSEIFFSQVKTTIEGLISWHKNQQLLSTKTGIDPQAQSLPTVIIIIRLLQLLCEGHNNDNQNILRVQENNTKSVNLLESVVYYFNELDNIPNETSIDASLAVAELILESIQGPCFENQNYLARETELLESLNRKMRRFGLSDEEKKIDLIYVVINITKGLMEGQGSSPVIYERILSVLHLDMIKTICLADEDEIDLPDEDEEEPPDPRFELKISCLVVLNMLCGYKPSIRDEIDFYFGDEAHSSLRSKNPKNNELLDSIRSVELVWLGQLQRVYFPVPEICMDLSKATRDLFIKEVDRQSDKSKLHGLLDEVPNMYREIKHIQLLKESKISSVVSLKNQYLSTWSNFTISVLINSLFVFYYYAKIIPCKSNDELTNSTSTNLTESIIHERMLFDLTHTMTVAPSLMMESILHGRQLEGEGGASYAWPEEEVCSYVLLDPIIEPAIKVLTVLLIICSLYSLLLYLLLNVPITYENLLDRKYTVFRATLLTAFDPMTLYYFGYFFFALFGLWLHDLLVFLPLDIMIHSSITKGVMDAVWKPRKVLTMTMILNLIIIYIFAAFAFFMYDNSQNFVDTELTNTLKLTFFDFLHLGSPYGVQLDLIVNLNTWRWFSDFFFFLSMFTTWNIIRGITIDTFMEQRMELDERMKDTLGKCFICGIEKNVFKRALNSEAYRKHILTDHNLWNYVYFIIHIWEQDKNDDDGLTSFIRTSLKEHNLSWFPSGKSMRLNAGLKKGVNGVRVQKDDSGKGLLAEELNEYQESILSQLSNFTENVHRSMQKVETMLSHGDQRPVKTPSLVFTPEVDTKSAAPPSLPPPPANPKVPTYDLKKATSFDKLAHPKRLRTESVDALEKLLTKTGSVEGGGFAVRLCLQVHSITGILLSNSDLHGIYCRVTSITHDHIITPNEISFLDQECILSFDCDSDMELHKWTNMEAAISDTGHNASFIRIQIAALLQDEEPSPQSPSGQTITRQVDFDGEKVAKSHFIGVVYISLSAIRASILNNPNAQITLPFTQKWKNEKNLSQSCKVVFTASIRN